MDILSSETMLNLVQVQCVALAVGVRIRVRDNM
mgnify:CR=1